jgi:hypothetical protein
MGILLYVHFANKNCLPAARFKHATFKSKCHLTTELRKIKDLLASATLLPLPMQHKYYSGNINNNTDDCFSLVNRRFLGIYTSETNN